jgi:hypothetical protein
MLRISRDSDTDFALLQLSNLFRRDNRRTAHPQRPRRLWNRRLRRGDRPAITQRNTCCRYCASGEASSPLAIRLRRRADTDSPLSLKREARRIQARPFTPGHAAAETGCSRCDGPCRRPADTRQACIATRVHVRVRVHLRVYAAMYECV